jgi:hypothetical protein
MKNHNLHSLILTTTIVSGLAISVPAIADDASSGSVTPSKQATKVYNADLKKLQDQQTLINNELAAGTITQAQAAKDNAQNTKLMNTLNNDYKKGTLLQAEQTTGMLGGVLSLSNQIGTLTATVPVQEATYKAAQKINTADQQKVTNQTNAINADLAAGKITQAQATADLARLTKVSTELSTGVSNGYIAAYQLPWGPSTTQPSAQQIATQLNNNAAAIQNQVKAPKKSSSTTTTTTTTTSTGTPKKGMATSASTVAAPVASVSTVASSVAVKAVAAPKATAAVKAVAAPKATAATVAVKAAVAAPVAVKAVAAPVAVKLSSAVASVKSVSKPVVSAPVAVAPKAVKKTTK